MFFTFLVCIFAFWFLIFGIAPSAQAAGLVPCGGPGENPCTFCHLIQLFDKVLNFAIYIVFPIATVMIIYGGFKVLTAGGNPGRAQEGRKVITAAAVGILIALLSWLILDTIFNILAGNNLSAVIGRPWYVLSCQ